MLITLLNFQKCLLGSFEISVNKNYQKQRRFYNLSLVMRLSKISNDGWLKDGYVDAIEQLDINSIKPYTSNFV